MKTITSFFLIAFLLIGYSSSAQSYEAWLKSAGKKPQKTTTKTSTKTTKETAAKSATAPVGMFTGTIPCADCEGILMELSVKGTPKDQNRSFILKQTYLGKPAGKNTFTSSGTWFLAKGNKQDPKAMVLQLIPKGNYEPIYLLQAGNSQLKMLDHQQNEIKSKHNYTLQKR
ncbi:copper resistance protein NlpE [Pontibacter vulgaris]|uniref:copper resistance protein NlpE n=1 Tax=Pontibacter vulgaris TaxID=2905679 RepID=UPI001FA7ECF0|nr:copper resistance protein NlpE [Pontibacter vulgaris]